MLLSLKSYSLQCMWVDLVCLLAETEVVKDKLVNTLIVYGNFRTLPMGLYC